MDTEDKRKQLKFRAWHRGTKEMDLIIGSFADHNLDRMNEKELAAFEEFLDMNDPELYDWYIGAKPVPANLDSPLITSFIAHKVPVAK